MALLVHQGFLRDVIFLEAQGKEILAEYQRNSVRIRGPEGKGKGMFGWGSGKS
jgi:hypothetical protein